jgi:hypothetical protein
VDNVFPDEEIAEPIRVAEVASAVVDTQMIEKAADDTMVLFKDGFQISDIFPAISNLMEMAEVVDGATGEEKKELVLQGAKRIYTKLDPDISSWIPQWLEKKAINWALEVMLPHAVDWAIGLTQGKLKVNKPTE